MPYQIQQIIEGKGKPVMVTKDDPVSKALSLMIEHDFSQLPVLIPDSSSSDHLKSIGVMVTYEGILRGIRNFKAKIDDLRVRDVMIDAPVCTLEDDLFDILDKLKDTNAVLIREIDSSNLVGIVTNYDTTEYFRSRTEDLMRVEDIEVTVKDFIKTAYLDENGELNQSKLESAITQATVYRRTSTQSEKIPSFDELNLSEYITLLLSKETWAFFEPIFGVQKNFVNELLKGIRDIRNTLAHFRGDISPEQRDQLKFGMKWFARRQEEYQALKEEQAKQKSVKQPENGALTPMITGLEILRDRIQEITGPMGFVVTEAATGGGRYAVLADWLQSQPGRIDNVQLTFNQIEEIIGADLPASARNHRAWWANDSVGHSHSQLWLEAGWRTTYINLGEGKITFSRIREREKAYITFFSKLLDELRKKENFAVREVSPDGASWVIIQTIPRSGTSIGQFTFSFSRDKRLRVELYLDMGDQNQTKAVFDKLFSQKEQFEDQLGSIEWERLDNRRASRLALYHEGHILEEKGHAELRKWATETMVKFCNTLMKPAEKAISEVKSA